MEAEDGAFSLLRQVSFTGSLGHQWDQMQSDS